MTLKLSLTGDSHSQIDDISMGCIVIVYPYSGHKGAGTHYICMTKTCNEYEVDGLP